jgi:3-phosphoshikimate 1-carboxyvinyltransferase
MDKTLLSGRVEGRVVLPCSKSYAQRALAASLLCRGRSTLRNMDLCCDTQSALRCIEALGAKVNRLSETEVEVCGGLAPAQSVLYVGESGLATRLFTPIASLCDSPITICGEGTLLHRPMEMMVEPLRRLGVDVRDGGGRLPIEVCCPMRGG